MMFFGAFDKGSDHYRDPYIDMNRFKGVECPAIVEDWFAFYIVLCPSAMFLALFAGHKARFQHNMFTYNIETWNRKY